MEKTRIISGASKLPKGCRCLNAVRSNMVVGGGRGLSRVETFHSLQRLVQAWSISFWLAISKLRHASTRSPISYCTAELCFSSTTHDDQRDGPGGEKTRTGRCPQWRQRHCSSSSGHVRTSAMPRPREHATSRSKRAAAGWLHALAWSGSLRCTIKGMVRGWLRLSCLERLSPDSTIRACVHACVCTGQIF